MLVNPALYTYPLWETKESSRLERNVDGILTFEGEPTRYLVTLDLIGFSSKRNALSWLARSGATILRWTSKALVVRSDAGRLCSSDTELPCTYAPQRVNLTWDIHAVNQSNESSSNTVQYLFDKRQRRARVMRVGRSMAKRTTPVALGLLYNVHQFSWHADS